MTTSNKLELIISAQNKASKVLSQIAADVSGMSRKAVPKIKATGTAFDALDKDIKQTNATVRTSSTLFTKLAGVLSAGAIVYAIKRIGEASIATASDLEEVGSKFDTVFADQAKAANAWARELQDGYAMSRRESKEYLSSIQDLLVPMGMASDAAGKMSSDVVKLAADLGSFNNKTTAQVMDDYQSALVGNYETMKKYGVVLNATVVQQKAMEMGLAASKNELTASDKAMAAHQLIIEGSTAAMGDMGRTAEQYANTSKQLTADIENLSGTIGNSLLPSATKIKASISEWIRANEQLIGQHVAEYVQGIASSISNSITWFKAHQTVIKSTAAALGTAVVTYGKFWALTKAIAASTALVTFFKGVLQSVVALRAGTLALNTAMKANLAAIALMAGYTIGSAIGKAADGTVGIEAEIESIQKWTAAQNEKIAAREKEIQARDDQLAATQKWADNIEAMEAANVAQAAQASAQAAENYATYAEMTQAYSKNILEAERKTLSERLTEYQSFFTDLQAKIKAQAASEAAHIKELTALYKQKLSVQKSADDLIRGLNEINMTAAERFQSKQQALDEQMAAAMSLSGQEQIAAIERYKTAMAQFATEYAQGIDGVSGVSGSQVVSSAISAIEQATEAQKSAISELEDAKQHQIDTDREWLAQLEASAVEAVDDINFLQAALAEVDSLIAGLDKEIEITGVDYVTDVVNRIQSELAALKDKTVTITTVHRSVYTSSGSSFSDVSGSYASGTTYVPHTGIYELHEGEIVVKRKIADAIRNQDASTSGGASGGVTVEGGININLPAGVAQQSAQDWRDITRNYIIPELAAVGR
jgi:hypothetical protein